MSSRCVILSKIWGVPFFFLVANARLTNRVNVRHSDAGAPLLEGKLLDEDEVNILSKSYCLIFFFSDLELLRCPHLTHWQNVENVLHWHPTFQHRPSTDSESLCLLRSACTKKGIIVKIGASTSTPRCQCQPPLAWLPSSCNTSVHC
jgi:hypothetical protein